jgi:hypothetical protein
VNIVVNDTASPTLEAISSTPTSSPHTNPVTTEPTPAFASPTGSPVETKPTPPIADTNGTENTTSPTKSPTFSLDTATPTKSPGSTPVSSSNETTLAPTESPTDASNADQNKTVTFAPTLAPHYESIAENVTATFSPTSQPVLANESVPTSNQVLYSTNKTSSLSTLDQSWSSAASDQLALARIAGVTSRVAATTTLLGLERFCFLHPNASKDEIYAGVDEIQTLALPVLQSNRSACDNLLKQKDADNYRTLRESLEYASASCALAIKSQEKLIDVAQVIASGNTTTCEGLVTAKLMDLNQYDVQTAQNTIWVANIVLASLGGTLGLILMVMHPLPKGWGTAIIFIVASSYIFGYAAFMATWYAFDMSEASAWIGGTWWRNYYSVYLIGMGGWLLAICLCSILYMTMIRHPWLLGIWGGFAFGGVFGIQINTIGIWTFAYGLQPEYFTLSICMGASAALFILTFGLWSGLAPSTGGIQHFTSIWIGSYLFIKMIGVIVGSYPNEFDMSPPIAWETYVYISCMWVLALLVFIIQIFLYRILTPSPIVAAIPASKKDDPPSMKRGSSTKKRSTFRMGGTEHTEEETLSLLPEPVGSAQEARRRREEEEVVEFGGVRALRPESEKRRMFT